MDSMRIDVYGEVGVDDYLNRFLRHLRWKTRQWWITRSVGGIYGYVRNEFEVTPDGAPLNLPEGLVRITTSGISEVAVDKAIWRSCSHDALSDTTVPDYLMQMMDARYMLTTQDMSMFVVNAANACESAKDMAVERAWKGQNEGQKFARGKVLNGYDLTQHIEGPLRRLTGRSFAEEVPDAFGELGKLWDARGSVAHGGSPHYRSNGKRIAVDGETAKAMIDATETFVNWTDGLMT